jgi:hypothetical protein
VRTASRRALSYLRHQRGKAGDPAGEVRACVVGVLQQVADPEIARTTRAVMRTVRPADSTGAPGVRLRHVAACAVFGLMEQFLWSERSPDDADLEHLLGWILRG